MLPGKQMKRWSFEKQSLSQRSDPPVARAADERFPPPSPASIARNSRENPRRGEHGTREDRQRGGVRQKRSGDEEQDEE